MEGIPERAHVADPQAAKILAERRPSTEEVVRLLSYFAGRGYGKKSDLHVILNFAQNVRLY